MRKYRLISKKGEGTFSEVLKAQSIKNGNCYAIKCMKTHFHSLEQVNNLREIQALRRLSPHPNIIKLEEVLYDKPTGRLALVFELMDMNLYELIRGRRHYLDPQLIKIYSWQLLRSIAHMHEKGVFHRDLKPENILIENNYDVYTGLKLADFGSCRGMYSKQPYTEYISTRWYRAPECLLTDGYYGPEMDVWGVGCVLFEISALYPLFPGTNELDQIRRIHTVLGTPDEKFLARYRSRASAHIEFNFPPQEGTGIKRLVPHLSDDCVELLESLLRYDPARRISAKDALAHPYFDDLRNEPEPDWVRTPQFDPTGSKRRGRDKKRGSGSKGDADASGTSPREDAAAATSSSKHSKHVKSGRHRSGPSGGTGDGGSAAAEKSVKIAAAKGKPRDKARRKKSPPPPAVDDDSEIEETTTSATGALPQLHASKGMPAAAAEETDDIVDEVDEAATTSKKSTARTSKSHRHHGTGDHTAGTGVGSTTTRSHRSTKGAKQRKLKAPPHSPTTLTGSFASGEAPGRHGQVRTGGTSATDASASKSHKKHRDREQRHHGHHGSDKAHRHGEAKAMRVHSLSIGDANSSLPQLGGSGRGAQRDASDDVGALPSLGGAGGSSRRLQPPGGSGVGASSLPSVGGGAAGGTYSHTARSNAPAVGTGSGSHKYGHRSGYPSHGAYSSKYGSGGSSYTKPSRLMGGGGGAARNGGPYAEASGSHYGSGYQSKPRVYKKATKVGSTQRSQYSAYFSDVGGGRGGGKGGQSSFGSGARFR